MQNQKILLSTSKIKFGVKRKGLSLIATFILLGIFFLLLDQSNLPDYESYERIYQNSLLGEEWEIFFVLLNFLFRQSGLSYSDFRSFIFLFSSFGLWLLLLQLHISYKEIPVSASVGYSIFLFFILAVLLFEYFVIRIRAGFAMGLIFYAIIFLKSKRVWIGRFFAALFLMSAFFTHKSTTVILTVFLMFPFTALMWSGRLGKKNLFYTIFSLVAVYFLLHTLNSSYELRGEHIHSPLNPVRFLMLSVVPLALALFIKNESSSSKKRRIAVSDFSFYFVRFYIVLALALAFMFFLGLTGESGEALVRLYTLSSIPALLSLRLTGSIMRAPISAYIVFINALFFLVTVLLPSDTG